MTREEFKILFDAHFTRVRNYLLYRSGNTEQATDIAQEAFLKLWEKGDQIRIADAPGLLFKIANDLFLSYYRKEKRSFDLLTHYELNNQANSPEDEYNFNQLKENYEKALARMPENQRTVFLMNRMDGLSYPEIAVICGIGTKAVEKRMSKALDFLRKNLQRND